MRECLEPAPYPHVVSGEVRECLEPAPYPHVLGGEVRECLEPAPYPHVLGGEVRECLEPAPYPHVLGGEVGSVLQTDRRRLFSHRFWSPPPPPLQRFFAGLGAARKTGPLPVLAPPNHPWREWLVLPLLPPLPPPVSINECDRAPATIKGSPKLGQFAHGHQHHPPRCVEMGGGGETHCTKCTLVSRDGRIGTMVPATHDSQFAAIVVLSFKSR